MNKRGVGYSGLFKSTEVDFKEFELRPKFKPRLKYGWLNLKLYQRFKPALNLNRVLADLNLGLNSLNSISGDITLCDPPLDYNVAHPIQTAPLKHMSI